MVFYLKREGENTACVMDNVQNSRDPRWVVAFNQCRASKTAYPIGYRHRPIGRNVRSNNSQFSVVVQFTSILHIDMASAVPRNVSPLIRAGRWSLLLGGLVYGRMHYNTVLQREEKVRPGEIDRVTSEAIHGLASKKIKADQSMVDLAYAAGVDPNKAKTHA